MEHEYESLNTELVFAKNENWLLRETVRIRDEQLKNPLQNSLEDEKQIVNLRLPDYQQLRERTLNKLKMGRQSAAGKAIDAFIKELEKPHPTPAFTAVPKAIEPPCGTAALLVDEAIKMLNSGTYYNREHFFDDLEQIAQRCGYSLFKEVEGLGTSKEKWFLTPKNNRGQKLFRTGNHYDLADWLRKQDLEE